MKRAVLAVLSSVMVVSGAYAAPTISLVGDGDGYDEEFVNGFRSSGFTKSYDLNGDNVYGSHGIFFFGDGLPDDKGGNPFTTHTQVDAEWATFSPGTNFASVAEGFSFSYAVIDDPNAIPGLDVADWDIRSGGGVANTPAGASNWCEILTFDIDATTPSVFRLGLMASNLNNENWNPMGLRVSVDGGAPVAVTNLPGTVGMANMVFFDVDLNGATSGTFSIEGQRRAATQGASLAGVTFDSTGAVTWPGGALALGQASLSLDLIAPDTSTNAIIDALYVAGGATTDVQIISAVADAGFSASYINNTLGAANTNEAITVTFDNTSIGLENGESTNSTLVVTWTAVGSGVTNTSEAALDVTYINVPNSLSRSPASLSLVLEGPDTATNGVVAVSYVEGTIAKDVVVVSVVSTNADFSAAPTGFTLNSGSPNQDITVTYTNTGALENHLDTDASTLIISWTEAGSGVTNTSQVALDVTYNNNAQVTEIWTIGIDFGATASADPNNSWNQFSVGGTETTPGMTNTEAVVLSSLIDTGNNPVSGVEFSVSNATGQIAWDFSGGLAGGNPVETIITNESVYSDGLISNDKASRPVVAGDDYFVFTFTGLDDGLLYDLVGGWDNNNGNFNTVWTADGQSLTMYPQYKSFKTFEGIGTDGNGNLVITVTGEGNAAHVTVAALTLRAYSIAPSEIGAASLSVLPGGTEVAICWPGQAGITYAIEATDNLVIGNWTNINSGIVGIGGEMCVTNAITGDQHFFRPVLDN